MARNKKVEILSNDKEVLHPMTDGDCVIFEDGQTLTLTSRDCRISLQKDIVAYLKSQSMLSYKIN